MTIVVRAKLPSKRRLFVRWCLTFFSGIFQPLPASIIYPFHEYTTNLSSWNSPKYTREATRPSVLQCDYLSIPSAALHTYTLTHRGTHTHSTVVLRETRPGSWSWSSWSSWSSLVVAYRVRGTLRIRVLSLNTESRQ